MFGFGERTLGEKVVMIGAGALVVGNTAMNIVNTVKVKNVKKRVNTLECSIVSINDRLNEIDKMMANNSTPQNGQTQE